ncbi:MAG: sugar phosphate isomerase/epimerase [Phycisphaerales bacterium]|nr:sugar phosphate isomerase/epimerase [Phycisphaerales bacterium]
MKLGFSTNAFKKTTLEDAIQVIGRIGYRGVEIMADVPHAYPPEMPPDRIKRLIQQLRDLKLEVSNVNAFTLFALGDTYHPTWIEDDPALRKQRVLHTHNVMHLAFAIGAKTISLQPGGPQGTLKREDALKRYEDGLRSCLWTAEQLDIKLLIEPEPGLMIQYSRECVDFLKQVNHPNLKMNCDLGHFYCMEEDPAKVLRECAPWIEHIHLEDIKANRVHQHRVPGEGAMVWPEIFAAIREIKYDGWLTVELYPYESTAGEVAKKAWDFLQKYL